MLFGPKWEKTTKADPFALESLIAWLERKPAQETYCYISIGHCLIAQYLNENGVQTINVNPDGYYAGLKQRAFVKLPAVLNEIAKGQPHTFGAALERARASLVAE